MKRIPVSKFRRELNQWVRKNEQIILTRNGNDQYVWIPIKGESDENTARVGNDGSRGVFNNTSGKNI